jgi:OmpA-OmpF porin, OOP family
MDDPDVEVVISGHTSAAGTKDHNQKLSEKRASSVRDYLMNVGKIQPSRLSVIGYGATKPLVPEPNPEQINSAAAKANMRVGFDVLEK